jgi:hypothetical protein
MLLVESASTREASQFPLVGDRRRGVSTESQKDAQVSALPVQDLQVAQVARSHSKMSLEQSPLGSH